MRRALELAERGWGQVQPNPLVGAVIVREGQVVGSGYHARWGEPHAEVEALRDAGERARGAVLYVNLEPCHHAGKTGPCTREIQRAGVRRVVYALDDPNPTATGGGSWLREQGIEVETGVCREEAEELNAPHLVRHRKGRPFVALKYALSLDARLAERPGTETEVTGAEARREAHRLRAGHQAVMVGIGTVLSDDPALTVRHGEEPRTPPVRIVLDSALRLPETSQLARTAREVPVLAFAAPDASEGRARRLEDRGIDVVRVERAPDGPGLDLAAALVELSERDLHSVLCEGGARLGSSVLAAGIVDRFYLFIAPRLFGAPGPYAFDAARGQAPRDWKLIDRRSVGPDTLLVLSAVAPPDA